MSVAPNTIVVSRCDRLGDLVLSLPTLGFLRDAGFSRRILHCAPYARDVGTWALHNGLCTDLWMAGGPSPVSLDPAGAVGLALFHCDATVAAFRGLGLKRTLGPRPKLSALWSYRWSVPQHRSRVAMSEMNYNVALARALLRHLNVEAPEFRGLPALKLPPEWRAPSSSPDLVVVVSNNGSAGNWPVESYVQVAVAALGEGRSVEVLAAGADAPARKKILEKIPEVAGGRIGLRGDFASVAELIAYLAGAREVFSSSTGPLHLAHAAGVPVRAVYPSFAAKKVESFERWRPDGYWHASPVRYETI